MNTPSHSTHQPPLASCHAEIEIRPQGRSWLAHPAWALGSTLLWGLIELMALARSRRRTG